MTRSSKTKKVEKYGLPPSHADTVERLKRLYMQLQQSGIDPEVLVQGYEAPKPKLDPVTEELWKLWDSQPKSNPVSVSGAQVASATASSGPYGYLNPKPGRIIPVSGNPTS